MHPKTKVTANLPASSFGFDIDFELDTSNPLSLASLQTQIETKMDKVIDKTPEVMFTNMGFAKKPDALADDYALLYRVPGTRHLQCYAERSSNVLLEQACESEPRQSTVDLVMLFNGGF